MLSHHISEFVNIKKNGEQDFQNCRGKTLESKPNLMEEEKLELQIKELEHRKISIWRQKMAS